MHVYVLVQVDRPLSTQRSEDIGSHGVRLQMFARCLVWCADAGLHECATHQCLTAVSSLQPPVLRHLYSFS